MSTDKRDPIFESLDRLADLADLPGSTDRLPDIARRVRVARRRRQVGLVAATALLAAGGVGLWQNLPVGHGEPPVVPAGPAPAQRVTLDVTPADPHLLRISFRVTGTSTAYADGATGDPTSIAGPRSTTVSVDGRVVDRSDAGDLDCRPGGALTDYSQDYPAAGVLTVPVSSGERHTVVVDAPYCSEGDLVKSSATVVVAARGVAYTSFDKLRADLDGDGEPETVEVLVPDDVTVETQRLRVRWGTGESTVASLPNTMETSLLDPRDLDGDGDLEVLLQGGGGELSVVTVFQADPGAVEQVRTAAAGGGKADLRSYATPGTWQTYVGPDGISSYRLVDPNPAQFPAPVEIRTWTLVGSTLTRSATSASGCVTFQPRTSLGPC